jgi:hypothetical protein
MIDTLQAAVAATGPSWQGIGTLVIGALQALLFWMLGQSSQDRREIRSAIDHVKGEVATLNAHVGVDGNGIISRLDTMSAKLDRIAEEMAEARGRR